MNERVLYPGQCGEICVVQEEAGIYYYYKSELCTLPHVFNEGVVGLIFLSENCFRLSMYLNT